MAKILVVDDRPINRDSLSTLLGYVHHQVTEAANALEALHLVRTTRPDLIISDVMMPEMDGYEFVRQLRDNPEIAHTPVIFCTALFVEAEARDLARKCGVSCVLAKPWEPEAVLSAVETCLRTPGQSPPVDKDFERQHLRLLTDKLSGKADELESFVADLAERTKSEAQSQLFRSLVEVARDYAIFLIDPDGIVLTWNEGAVRLTGYMAAGAIGRPVSQFYPTVEAGVKVARAQGRFQNEVWHIRRDGSGFWAAVTLTALVNDDGTLRGFSSITHDVSVRRNAEIALRRSENELRQIADAMPQIVWTARPDGQADYFNGRWTEFTGLAADRWLAVLHPESVEAYLDAWHTAVRERRPFEVETRLYDRGRDGWRWHLGRAVPLYGEKKDIVKWIGTFTDIDDHKRRNEELERRVEERTRELSRSLQEKTTLLQEVHHRVNNNLQVICSLLTMQIACSPETAAADVLKDAQRRVLAMSLIHKQLYQSTTLSDVDFGRYVESLSAALFSAYCVQPDRVRMELSVEPIRLAIDEAIPAGLILNELLANALKHGFPQGRAGVVSVGFRHVESASGSTRVELSVADNGIGLPPDFQYESSPSMGLKVVHSLSGQLRAEIEVSGNGGSAWVLRWNPEEPEKARQASSGGNR